MNFFDISEKKEKKSKKRELEKEGEGFAREGATSEEKYTDARAKRVQIDVISPGEDLKPFLLINPFECFEKLKEAFSSKDLRKVHDILVQLFKMEKARESLGSKSDRVEVSDFFLLQILNIRYMLGQDIHPSEIEVSKSLMICRDLADYLIMNGDEEQVIFNYLKILSEIELLKNSFHGNGGYSASILLAHLEELKLEEALDISIHRNEEIADRILRFPSDSQLENERLNASMYELVSLQIMLLKTSGHLTMRDPISCRPFLVEFKTNQKNILELLVKASKRIEMTGEKTDLVFRFSSILSELGNVRKKMLDLSLGFKV